MLAFTAVPSLAQASICQKLISLRDRVLRSSSDATATQDLSAARVQIDPEWWASFLAANSARKIRHLILSDGRRVGIGRAVGGNNRGRDQRS